MLACLDKPFNILLRVVEIDGGPDGGFAGKNFRKKLGAMLARPDIDALACEISGGILGEDALHVERDDPAVGILAVEDVILVCLQAVQL